MKIAAPDLSVIIPSLHCNDFYLRCLYSVRSALRDKLSYEIVSVVRDVDTFSGLVAEDLSIIPETEPGIYNAMNLGVENSRGAYLYFIGQDDILLPEAAQAVRNGLDLSADLILANVFWGRGRIFKNRASRHALVWKNWCHQGVFYNRLKFLDTIGKFPVKFRAQADHYANIVLSGTADLTVARHKGCVAWYAATGFSSQVADLTFRNEFPELIRRHYGPVSYRSVVLRRALLRIFRPALSI